MFLSILVCSKYINTPHCVHVIDQLSSSHVKKPLACKYNDRCKIDACNSNKRRKKFSLAFGHSKFFIIRNYYFKCRVHNEFFEAVSDSSIEEEIYAFSSNNDVKSSKIKIHQFVWLHISCIKCIFYQFWKKPSISGAVKFLISQYASSYINYCIQNYINYDIKQIEKEIATILPTTEWFRSKLMHVFYHYLDVNKYQMFYIISQIPMNEFGWDWTFWPDKLRSFIIDPNSFIRRCCKVKASSGYLVCGIGFIVASMPLFGGSESNLQVAKLVAPAIVRNWIFCPSKIDTNYLFCTDSVKKQWFIRDIFIRYLIRYINKYFAGHVCCSNIKLDRDGVIDIKTSKFVVKFNTFNYNVCQIGIDLALDPAHWGRRIYSKLPRRHPLTYIHKKNVNFVFRSATVASQVVDISQYPIGVEWYAIMCEQLTEDNVKILQVLVLSYMARKSLSYTRWTSNTSKIAKIVHQKKVKAIRDELLHNLVSNMQWCQYLMDIINWIIKQVPRCMHFYALSIFRPDMTLAKWSSKQLNFKVIINYKEETIKVPAFSVSWYFYKCLVQNIAGNPTTLIWKRSFQDVCQLQVDALAIFELKYFFFLYTYIL